MGDRFLVAVLKTAVNIFRDYMSHLSSKTFCTVFKNILLWMNKDVTFLLCVEALMLCLCFFLCFQCLVALIPILPTQISAEVEFLVHHPLDALLIKNFILIDSGILAIVALHFLVVANLTVTECVSEFGFFPLEPSCFAVQLLFSLLLKEQLLCIGDTYAE